MSALLLFLCVVLWGISTFLNRLSVEHLPPLMMQVVVGLVFVVYMPLAFKLEGVSNPLTYKWSTHSVMLTVIATVISIAANVFLYMYLKGNPSTGSSTMILSLYPVVTLILSYFFLHEQFTGTKIAGVFAMIIGSILLCWK